VVADTALEALSAALDRRFGLDALWVFGSEARGAAGPRSDLDLAALFRRRPSALELLEARAELAPLAGRELDLVDLDRTTPVLAMQVMRLGRLVVDRNPRRRHAFLARLLGRYDDVRRLTAPIERRIAERLAHGRA